MENKLSRRYAGNSLIAVCAMSFCASGVSWGTISLYAAPVVKELGISAAQFMFMLTLLVVINAFSSLFLYGSIIGKLGIRRAVVLGMTLLTAAQAIWALSENLAMLYAGAAVMGAGIITITANSQVLILNGWFTKRGGTYIGIANTVGSVSGMVSAAVYGGLIASLGWRALFAVTCAFDLAGLIVVLFLFKGLPNDVGVSPLYADGAEAGRASGGETGMSLREMLRSPRFYILSALYFVVGVIGYGAMGNLALMLSELGRASIAGIAVSVTMLGSAATMTLCGYVCDRFASKWFVSAAMLLAAAVMIALTLANLPAVPLLAAAALLGIAYNATQFPAGIAVKENFGTKEYGKKVGLLTGCCLFGLGAGPTLLQIMKNITGGYQSTLIYLSAAAAATAVLLIITSRTHNPTP